MGLSPDAFAYVCNLVRRESAIVLESGKEYLVAINHGTDAVSLQTSGFDLLTQEQARGMLVLNAGDVAVIRTQRTAEGGGR